MERERAVLPLHFWEHSRITQPCNNFDMLRALIYFSD
jgi:hypothetical protein